MAGDIRVFQVLLFSKLKKSILAAIPALTLPAVSPGLLFTSGCAVGSEVNSLRDVMLGRWHMTAATTDWLQRSQADRTEDRGRLLAASVMEWGGECGGLCFFFIILEQ